MPALASSIPMKSILKSILSAGGFGLLSTIPVATQLLHEDFDSYSDGSVNGQGLWTASAGIDVFSDVNGVLESTWVPPPPRRQRPGHWMVRFHSARMMFRC